MLVVRPVTPDDLDPLVALASQAGHGLTTLPQDRQILRRRIVESVRGFERMAQDERPRGETYLFVLEDQATGQVVGTCGIVSKVGGFEPFYAYRIETAVHESDVLKVRREVPFLRLVAEHNGPTEVGSLFLAPEYRRDGNGRLLSLVRLLFIAEFPDLFDTVVLAEMRGVSDEKGCSPFWDALGGHFFTVEFCKADYLSMVNKKFIADLMPAHPIYIPLLPKEAQAVVGQVHPQSRPALRILEEEGFTFAKMIDIFDGGPIVSCPRGQIRTVRDGVRAAVGKVTDDPPIKSPPYLIGNGRRQYRACQGPLEVLPDGRVKLSSATALTLGVRVGDPVRYVLLRAPAAAAAEAAASSAAGGAPAAALATAIEQEVAAAKQETPPQELVK